MDRGRSAQYGLSLALDHVIPWTLPYSVLKQCMMLPSGGIISRGNNIS